MHTFRTMGSGRYEIGHTIRRPIKRGMINSCIENHCPRYRSET